MINRKHTKIALIIMDMQKGAWDDPNYPRNPEESRIQLASIKDILRYGARNGFLIGWIESSTYGQTLPELVGWIKHDFHLKKCIGKGNAFEETSLDSILKKRGIDTLVIMGSNASWCVYKTTVNALELKYKVIISPQLVTDDTVKYKKTIWDFYRENTIFKETAKEVKRHLQNKRSSMGRTGRKTRVKKMLAPTPAMLITPLQNWRTAFKPGLKLNRSLQKKPERITAKRRG